MPAVLQGVHHEGEKKASAAAAAAAAKHVGTHTAAMISCLIEPSFCSPASHSRGCQTIPGARRGGGAEPIRIYRVIATASYSTEGVTRVCLGAMSLIPSCSPSGTLNTHQHLLSSRLQSIFKNLHTTSDEHQRSIQSIQ